MRANPKHRAAGRHKPADGDGPHKWIAGAIHHPGALHRALGVPEGEKIPAEKMAAARHSKSGKVRKMAALAHTLGGFHHK